jgi:E3 ubiquitin-protein ligase MARCH6
MYGLVIHLYPGIFAIAGLSRTFIVSFGLLSTWSQAIRDKEFLVEMRLRNLEPEKDRVERATSTSKDTEGDASEMSVD